MDKILQIKKVDNSQRKSEKYRICGLRQNFSTFLFGGPPTQQSFLTRRRIKGLSLASFLFHVQQ